MFRLGGSQGPDNPKAADYQKGDVDSQEADNSQSADYHHGPDNYIIIKGWYTWRHIMTLTDVDYQMITSMIT